MVKNAKFILYLFVFALVFLSAGTALTVWANVVGNRRIDMTGDVNMNVGDVSLYVDDVRVKENADTSESGTTISTFQPGFVNEQFVLDLGNYITSSGNFTIYLDVINCSTKTLSANATTTLSGVNISVSGIINGDAVNAGEITSSTPLSGTIVMSVTATSSSVVNLDSITVKINEIIPVVSSNTTLGNVSYESSTKTATASFVGPDAQFEGWQDEEGNVLSWDLVWNMADLDLNKTYTAIFKDADTNLSFYSFGNEMTVVDCNDSATQVVIPSYVKNTNGEFKVSIIGGNAFSNCRSLQNVIIPNTITRISMNAFNQCANLQSVVIPDSISIIEEYTFSNCSSLQSIIIPDSVSEIGSSAFYGCESLIDIKLSENIMEIDESTFAMCIGLKEIVIPDNVFNINEQAFYGCFNLTKITFGNSCWGFSGSEIFYGCDKLNTIVVKNSYFYDSISEHFNNMLFPGINTLDTIKVLKTADDGTNTYLKNNFMKVDDGEYNSYQKTVEFNGTSDYIALGRDSMFEDRFTISFEAYMDNWSEYATKNMRLISCAEGGGWDFETLNENIIFAIYDKGVGYKSAISSVSWSSLSSGWHSFKAVFDGSKAYVYLDNNLIATSEQFSSGKVGYNSTNGIFVGAEAGPSTTTPIGQYFKGIIRNLTIINSVV